MPLIWEHPNLQCLHMSILHLVIAQNVNCCPVSHICIWFAFLSFLAPDQSTRATPVSLRLSVVSWATLEQHVPLTRQSLVKGQVTSGWTMSTVLGLRLCCLPATSMVGESATVVTVTMQGLSVQVRRFLHPPRLFAFFLFFTSAFPVLHLHSSPFSSS